MNYAPTDPSRDRRLALRFSIKVPLRVRVRRASDAAEIKTESQDLSMRGVRFRTSLPLSAGATVDVLIEMPEEVTESPSALWLCTGRVVRVKLQPEGLEASVQFDFYDVSHSERAPWAAGVSLRGPYQSRPEIT